MKYTVNNSIVFNSEGEPRVISHIVTEYPLGQGYEILGDDGKVIGSYKFDEGRLIVETTIETGQVKMDINNPTGPITMNRLTPYHEGLRAGLEKAQAIAHTESQKLRGQAGNDLRETVALSYSIEMANKIENRIKEVINANKR